MAVSAPRYGMLSTTVEKLNNSQTANPWGWDQGSGDVEGTTFPESVRLLSMQLVLETTTVPMAGTSKARTRIWRNALSGSPILQPSDIFHGQLGWKRQIDTTVLSAAAAIFMGEDTGSPDKLICRTENFNNPGQGAVSKHITNTIHYRYLLDDVATVGPMGVTRPRWVTPCVYYIVMNKDITRNPFGGTVGGASEGTSVPSTLRWRSSQLVGRVATVGTGTTEEIQCNTFKNADDGTNEIFSTTTDLKTSGWARGYSSTVIDAGSELFIGEDADGTPDELLGEWDQISDSNIAKMQNVTMTLHAEFIP